jgi:hypothetical protein
MVRGPMLKATGSIPISISPPLKLELLAKKDDLRYLDAQDIRRINLL